MEAALFHQPLAQIGKRVRVSELAEIEAVETFIGYAILFTVDPDHQLSINIDDENPMALTGATKEYVARMLVHYQYPEETGPMPVRVQDGEIEPSSHSIFFPQVVSAEQPVEEGVMVFLKDFVRRKAPESYEKLKLENDEVDIEKFGELLSKVNSDILQSNKSANHTLAVLELGTPIEYAQHVKQNYLPDLRIACCTPGTILNLLRFDENSVSALIKGTVQAIQEQKTELERRRSEHKGSKANKIIIEGDVDSVLAGDHGTQNRQ